MYNVSQIGQRKYFVVETKLHEPASTTVKPLFWLDGVRSGEVLVDKTGNGRNFTITNRDFTVPGFPYKSASTISAPIGDAVLIAADVNNFLYDSGGTPNDIPVVSFFQNIDYEDIGFSRHLPQSVDVNGVEITQPTILDITWYPAVLTGQDLINAVAYYAVPTMDPLALHVSSTGYADVMAAQVDAINGDTIYVHTGTRNEFFSVSSDLMLLNKEITVIGIGNCIVEVDDLATACFFNKPNCSIEGLQFLETKTGQAVYTTGAFPISVNRCKVYNSAIAVRGENTTVDVTNSIINGSTGCFRTGGLDNVISGNHMVGPYGYIRVASAGINTITYNKAVVDNFIGIAGTTGVVKWNDVSFTKSFTLGDSAGAGVTLDVSFNTMSKTGILVFNYAEFEAGGYDVLKWNNNVCDSSDRSETITIAGQSDVEHNNNVYNSDGADIGIGVKIDTLGAAVNVTAHNSKWNVRADSPSLTIGNEVAVGYDTIIASIQNNVVLGDKLLVSSGHAFALFNQSALTIKYNYMNEAGLGIVYKNELDCSAGIVAYNLLVNCFHPMVIKGADKVKIYGNTIFTDYSIASTQHISFVLGDLTSNPPTDCEIKNNILYDISPAETSVELIVLASGMTGLVSDYNIIKTDNNDVSDTYATWALWQGAGFDANGQNVDPELDTDFVPQLGSPAIGAGETLAATFDDGLDESTDWGDASTLPVVVTKQQTAPWDIGAYVS